MWCSACRQDVPGIAPPSGGVCCCARCGGTLERDVAAVDHRCAVEADDCSDELLTPRAIFDSWQLEDAENDLLWLLRLPAEPAVAERRMKGLLADPAHPPQAMFALSQTPINERLAAPPHSRFGPFVAWLLIAAGMTAFTCGTALAGWSVWENQQQLWNWGVPIAMAGQIALITGLIMQLDLLGGVTRRKKRAAEPVAAMPRPHATMRQRI
jgi:hypothetical protein